jgi:hypothetical protein
MEGHADASRAQQKLIKAGTHKKVAESGAKWKKMSLLALFYANYFRWRGSAETTVATLTTSGGDESDM